MQFSVIFFVALEIAFLMTLVSSLKYEEIQYLPTTFVILRQISCGKVQKPPHIFLHKTV